MGKLNKAELAELHEQRIRIIWIKSKGDPNVAIPRIADYVTERISKVIRKERTRCKELQRMQRAEATDGKKGKAS
mgnify:CR=1 FL=1